MRGRPRGCSRAYGSAAEALTEWRAFAGPPAATAELASCPPELGIRLLDPALAGSPQGESVLGDEPRPTGCSPGGHRLLGLAWRDFPAGIIAE